MGKKSRKSKKATPYDPKTLADIAAGKVVAITREQALVGLIETAISLWVDGKDIGATHVLAFAAWKVLRDLGEKNGKGPELHKDSRTKDWLLDGYDFFRHTSPNRAVEKLHMPVRLNEIVIWDSILSFYRLFPTTRTPLMKTFCLWFMIDYRDYAKAIKDLLNEALPSDILLKELGKLSRSKFFELVLPRFGAEGPLHKPPP